MSAQTDFETAVGVVKALRQKIERLEAEAETREALLVDAYELLGKATGNPLGVEVELIALRLAVDQAAQIIEVAISAMGFEAQQEQARRWLAHPEVAQARAKVVR